MSTPGRNPFIRVQVDDDDVDDRYESLMSIQDRSRLHSALNTATINEQIDQLEELENKQNQQVILNASYLRERIRKAADTTDLSIRSVHTDRYEG